MPSPTEVINVAPFVPPGTSVSAYPASVRPLSQSNSAPTGTALETVTVASDNTATFTTLQYGRSYVAVAQVNGAWRYLAFTTPPQPDVVNASGSLTDVATQAELDAEIAVRQALSSSVANGSDVATLRTEVASVEDMITSGYAKATFAVASGAFYVPVFTAPFPLVVKAGSVCIFGGSNPVQAVSDTNYWTVQIRRERANAATIIATKNTRATPTGSTTAGEQIGRRTGWLFDGQGFDATNSVLSPGDTVDLLFTPTGTPSDLTDVLCTIRYQPLGG